MKTLPLIQFFFRFLKNLIFGLTPFLNLTIQLQDGCVAWSGIVWTGLRVASCWTVGGSNPGGGLPIFFIVGSDISGDLAIHYMLDAPGIASRWGASFSPSVQPDRAAHPASWTMCTGSLPRVKRPGRGVDHPLPKERVELYLYSHFGPS
jgi:hypothetical protein